MHELVAYPNEAWSYALGWLVFDLDTPACETLFGNENCLPRFVAAKSVELRRRGLFRREAKAENSASCAKLILDAASGQAVEGRTGLLQLPSGNDPGLLTLDSGLLARLLQLGKIVHETSFGNLYRAIAAGYYFQPDGSLDGLFAWLDREYGVEREYFRGFAFFALGECFLGLKFQNKTQLRVAMLKIRQVAEASNERPRIMVAAAWAFHCLEWVIRHYQQAQGEILPPLARALLAQA